MSVPMMPNDVAIDPDVSAASGGRPIGLRAGSVGLVGLATLGAVMMSPAMGLYATWGPMAGIVESPTPLVFPAALVVSAPTAVSYALVSLILAALALVLVVFLRVARPARLKTPAFEIES